jgi:ubiquinone/menaquinone biosynthesis C-methylase UbiE
VKLLGFFLRVFFDHFYTTLAWSYDAVAYLVSIGQWNRWVRSGGDSVEHDPVLEIGHGPGHLLLELKKRGRTVIGVDASRQMTRLAIRRLRGQVPIVQAQAQALPFPEESFRSIIATFPTEYILDPSTIAQIRRALRPWGKLIVVPVARIHGRALLDRMAAWLFQVTGQTGEITDSWIQPFVQAGFKIDRQELDLGRSTVTRFTATKSAAEAAP